MDSLQRMKAKVILCPAHACAYMCSYSYTYMCTCTDSTHTHIHPLSPHVHPQKEGEKQVIQKQKCIASPNRGTPASYQTSLLFQQFNNHLWSFVSIPCSRPRPAPTSGFVLKILGTKRWLSV